MAHEKSYSVSIALCIVLCLLGTNIAQAAVQSDIGRKCHDQKTNVVNFVNLESEIGSIKKSLDDVPSLAVLKNDPRGALPLSFTICSDTMSVFSTKENRLMFFNLIGSNEDQLLAAVMTGDIFFTTRAASGQIPTVFPNQWVRSCMAIDSESGFLQWVVDGTLVESNTIDRVRDTRNKPTNLTGKVVLGVWQSPGSKKWDSIWSNQVTNLNIFSTELTIKEMQQKTNGGRCAREGDYLAWKEMHWNLKGQAVIETVDEEEICNGGTSLNFFDAQFFPM